MQHHKRTIDQVLAGKRRWAMLRADCLDVMRLVRDASIDAVIVDPPYGMRYQGKSNKQPAILNDEHPFIWWLYDAHRATKDGGALICFCQWKRQEDFRTVITMAGFDVRSHVIWDRELHGMGHPGCTFAPRHDIAWFATKGRFKFPNGRPASVLRARSVPAKHRVHSTQKPDTLMEDVVRAVTPAGGVVLDCCAGSGSTGAAAVRLGYRFIGVELDQNNCAVARRRLRLAEKRSNT